GGCIYCNENGSGAPYIKRNLNWEEQFNTRIKEISNKKFIIYFQAFSNTYSSPENLEKLYNSALKKPDVIGISIGTRPDCVTPEILDLISCLSENSYIWLEYGLESIHDKTLELINRQHSLNDFLWAYYEARKRNIRTCIHFINGLPGETINEMLETAIFIGKLEPDGVKMHSLYIEKDTQLHKMYLKEPWKLLTEDEYIELAARCIENVPEKTVIHRLVGEAMSDRLVAPEWSKNKQKIIQGINNKLAEWNSKQGKKYVKSN
ncbi:TIGR01212 family radical SAM protein, partial [candidate division KSB1 bacterium]